MILESFYLNEVQITADFIRFLNEAMPPESDRIVIKDKGLIYECLFYNDNIIITSDDYHKQDSSENSKE